MVYKNPVINMKNAVFEFLNRHSSIIITTHDHADADGLGAERAFSQIVLSMGKQMRIINSSPTPENFTFMDPEYTIETWDAVQHELPEKAGMVILDTSDEYNIGKLKEYIPRAAEIFIIDHHEIAPLSKLKGYIDTSASSSCEMVVELAQDAGVVLSPDRARAAYAGIVYDTGFFAYSKTTNRTFKAALILVEDGVVPYDVYKELNEKATTGALLLQKAVFSTLEIHNQGRVAVQMLRKEDLENCGANFEDAEHFINIPLKSRDIEVSILIKENREGQVRCSLRSKGTVNVSKIAQTLGGGGHVRAAGFKSTHNPEETLHTILEKVGKALEKK